MRDGCPTAEQVIEAWNWWKSFPPKKRPSLGRREYSHEHRRVVWTGATQGYHVQLGQLIEAYGSISAALQVVEQRQLDHGAELKDWWDTIHVILSRMAQREV